MILNSCVCVLGVCDGGVFQMDGRGGYEDEPYGNENNRKRRERTDEPVRRRMSNDFYSDHAKRGRVATAGQG